MGQIPNFHRFFILKASLIESILNLENFNVKAKSLNIDKKPRVRRSSTSSVNSNKEILPIDIQKARREPHNEASWSHVDPKSKEGEALELSRDLVGFLFGYASPHRPHWTIDIMEDHVNNYLSAKTRTVKRARRKLRDKPTLLFSP